MYQYYLGERSNFDTKKIGDPTIIEALPEVSREITNWLDRYHVDLDVFVKAINAIQKLEIIRISIEDSNIFQLDFAHGINATIELLNEENPKCKFNVAENEYLFYIQNGCAMEKCIEVMNDIRVGADVTENKIFIGKDVVFLCIELEKFDEKLYYAIKSNINRLEIWDNIACVICWMSSLPVELVSYDLSIVSALDKKLSMIKLSVIYDRIVRYLYINQIGQYQVDDDDSWEAKQNGKLFQYSPYSNECYVSSDEQIDLIEFKHEVQFIEELIGIMLSTMKLINNSMVKVKKY